jgi:hypothetical protein
MRFKTKKNDYLKMYIDKILVFCKYKYKNKVL